MADDARAEIRERVAERIAFARYRGTAPADEWERLAADAVLELFPDRVPPVRVESQLLGPADEPRRNGAVVAVHWGDYRRQEIWVASGANIGNWYCLGGEFGTPRIADDPRSPFERETGWRPGQPRHWVQPPGTIPTHPDWSDVLARGPVVLLTAAEGDAYRAGWRAGRIALWQGMEDAAYDSPPTAGDDSNGEVDEDE